MEQDTGTNSIEFRGVRTLCNIESVGGDIWDYSDDARFWNGSVRRNLGRRSRGSRNNKQKGAREDETHTDGVIMGTANICREEAQVWKGTWQDKPSGPIHQICRRSDN